MVSIEFLITSFIVVVSPGTGVLYTLATGLSRGTRASIVAAFGCTLGIVPHMAASIMGRRPNTAAPHPATTRKGPKVCTTLPWRGLDSNYSYASAVKLVVASF